MHFFSMIALSLALSLDSFNVGTTYGLRKVKIPPPSILIIACFSGSAMLVSMIFGTSLDSVISLDTAQKTGGWILIAIGLWSLFQFLRSHTRLFHQPVSLKINIKKIEIIIQVVREPQTADLDQSGTLLGFEAFLLGAALSLDSFGAGIGAALVGYSPYLTAIVIGCMSGLFLSVGQWFGYCFRKLQWIRRCSFIPGCLLILLGILKM